MQITHYHITTTMTTVIVHERTHTQYDAIENASRTERAEFIYQQHESCISGEKRQREMKKIERTSHRQSSFEIRGWSD